MSEASRQEEKVKMNVIRPAVVACIVCLLLAPIPVRAQDQGAPRTAPDSLPPTIALFPLEDVMLFPNLNRPLHIFEPRYRAMVADALKGDRLIGMVMLEPGHEADYDGRPPVYMIGCAGFIDEVRMYPDGRYDIVLKGMTKFRITGEDQSRPYRLANVEALPEIVDEEERVGLRERRPRIVAAYATIAPDADPPPPELTDVDLVNGLAQFLAFTPLDRQQLLEAEGPLARSDMLLSLIEDSPDTSQTVR